MISAHLPFTFGGHLASGSTRTLTVISLVLSSEAYYRHQNTTIHSTSIVHTRTRTAYKKAYARAA